MAGKAFSSLSNLLLGFRTWHLEQQRPSGHLEESGQHSGLDATSGHLSLLCKKVAAICSNDCG